MKIADFRLAPRARLEITRESSWLLCDSPRVASQLNASAVELLVRVLDSGEPRELSQAQFSFLESLVDQGWLEMAPRLPASLPRVSVVVPVRNRPTEIEACLKTLMVLDYPADRLEVIVVDDASTDETPQVVRRFPVRLIVASQRQGASASRNLGIANATGDVVAFTDSDCQVTPSWLVDLIPFLYLPKCVAVGGRVLPAFEETVRDRYAAAYSALDMGLRMRRVTSGTSVFYVPSCNLLVRRDALLRVSGFDAGFPIGEDIDLEYRLMKDGGTVWYAARGGVYHVHRSNLKKRWRRQLDYAASEGYLQQRHPQLRKVWRVPLGELSAAAVALWAMASQQLWLLALLPLWIIVPAILRGRRLRSVPLAFGVGRLVAATVLGYWWDARSATWLLLRYYLIAALVLAGLFPVLWLPLVLLLLVASVSEYTWTKPKVQLPAFVPLYLLDGLAYHIGILTAVVRQGTLWPVRTRVRF